MRRLVLSLLILLLPLQFSWAVAASYCQHERPVDRQVPASAAGAASHFGHHEHEHEHGHKQVSERQHRSAHKQDCERSPDTAAAVSPNDGGSSADKSAPSKLAVDPDCATCHATPVVVLAAPGPGLAGLAASALRPPLAVRCESLPTRAPDRPQWLRLA